MVTKIKPGKPLWTTNSKPVSGAKMLYGIEVDDKIKEMYADKNLNEESLQEDENIV